MRTGFTPNLGAREGFPEKLNYGELIGPGVMLMKDDALLAGWEFNGPDLESASPAELNTLASQINAALLHLGDGWMLHHNVMRFPALSYPGNGEFPDPTTYLFDQERKAEYERAGALYENVSSLILTYKAPDPTHHLANKFFIDGYREYSTDLNQAAAVFENKIEQVEAGLCSVLRMRRMGDSSLLTLLHSCVTGLEHPIVVPNPPVDLSYYLGCQDLITGFYPRVGDRHFAVVGVTGFPQAAFPEILFSITQLPVPLRLCTRFIFADAYTSETRIDKKRAYWEQKRTRLTDIFARSVKWEDSGHVDQHADSMMDDALEAQAEAASGRIRYGHFTLTVVLSDQDRPRLIENAREVRKELQNRGLAARIETFNSLEAYLGSLPGHGYYDVRKPILHSLNVSHLTTFSTMWAGEERHPSPIYPEDSPAHLYCVASGSTPFRFNTFVDDTGSSIVIGPTGSGKTVLLNAMALQDFRYPDMQVFYFDKDYGAYLIAKATGGIHYDLLGEQLAPDDRSLSLYPLGGLDLPRERAWAADWVELLFTQQGLRITPEQRAYVVQALARLSTADSKTLTELLIPEDKELQTALKYYQLGGSSGGILDGSEDMLRDGRFQVFEQSHLLKKGDKLVVPTLAYIFHQIELRMDGRPTRIYIDEAWVSLMNAMSLEQVEDWLRTVRKKNGSLILATQSLVEITNCAIRDLILESCPVKIFLPNPEAQNPATRKHYEDIGLSEKQIELIAKAVRRRDYYYVSPVGKRLFSLNLTPFELSLVGVNGKKNRLRIDELVQQQAEGWVPAWLKERGLPAHAEKWKEVKNERYTAKEAPLATLIDVRADLFPVADKSAGRRNRSAKPRAKHRNLSEDNGDARDNDREHHQGEGRHGSAAAATEAP